MSSKSRELAVPISITNRRGLGDGGMLTYLVVDLVIALENNSTQCPRGDCFANDVNGSWEFKTRSRMLLGRDLK